MFQRLFGRGGKLKNKATQLGREFNVGDLIEQRFEVEQVRRGFMGIVYLAHDRQRPTHPGVIWTEHNAARWNLDVREDGSCHMSRIHVARMWRDAADCAYQVL